MVIISTVLLASLFPGGGQKSLDREALARIQVATGQLVVELEILQDDIVGEFSEHKERTLYSQAETVLSKAKDFQRALVAGSTREDLQNPFDDMDVRLQELVNAVRDLKPARRPLQRAAARAAASGEEICYLLFVDGSSPERTQRLIARQAAVFAEAAKELQRASRHVLADREGGAVIDANIKKLAEAADQFQKSALLKDKEGSQKDFANVGQAWAQVVMDLQKLPVAENAYLARNASRLDRIHDHLFGLLGLAGKRPGLVLRT